MPTIYDELCAVSGLTPEAGETFEDFAGRLTKKVNGLPDKDWEAVSKAGQAWQNETVTKLNEIRALKKDGKLDEAAEVKLPELDGFQALPAEEGKASAKSSATKSAAKAKPTAKAAAKPAKAAKPAASPKKAKADSKRGRPGIFPDNAKITLLVKENPHRAGTGRHKRWGKYKSGMTVKEALAAGLDPANLRYSVADGHIKIV